MNLWRWNKGIAERRRRPAVAAQGRAGLGRALRGPAPQGRRHRARDDQRRGHAALAGAAELHHAARLERALRPARQARPDRLRPRSRPATTSTRSARARSSPPSSCATSASCRSRRSPARAASTSSRRSSARATADEVRERAGELAERIAAERPDTLTTVLAQGQARGPDPRRRRPQHLRPDDRRALRRARAAGRAGGDAGQLGRGRRPWPAPAAVHAARRSRRGSPSGDPWADIDGSATLPKALTAVRLARSAPSRYCRSMGFLDKAKKLAEQAQTKLDEVQKQVNTHGSSRGAERRRSSEYDKHGRPIPPQQTATPPHGDPLTQAPPGAARRRPARRPTAAAPARAGGSVARHRPTPSVGA